jgi:competence protein ComEC
MTDKPPISKFISRVLVRNLTLIIFVSLLIVFRYFTTRPIYKNGDTVRITATILTDPVSYPGSQGLKVAGLTVYLPTFPEVSYGDGIVVEGIVDEGKLKNAKLISVSGNRSFGSFARNKIIFFYQKVLPQPMSGLTAGITLGSKGTLTSDFWNRVKFTGVAHVVVASGTNVTFVVSFLMGVLTLILPRKKAILFVIVGIILYLFLSGFDAPLVRAAIMAVLTFWAVETGRLVDAWRVLLLTGGIMLIIQPDWLGDIGFALSFVSTASIMLLEKRIAKWLRPVPGVLREGLSTSLAAQVGVAPILFVTFGRFNIWSPIINALVLWTIPYIMVLGSVGGVVGLMFPFLGKMILWLSYPLNWWFVKVVYLFG